ncbi:phosphotransferase enzyme family protein [Blastococcus sp. LR1]|uniref:phosphotransferase enzyme family protein n=1 Tax=Blastococcus sp. LR1 TaxID=2877000 RepID=UPI001CCB6950|nr:phosphotransferase [Blastococcus sp. LR1]MCA0144034.1 phosphotransferase [Blastococcus sp. LR1]
MDDPREIALTALRRYDLVPRRVSRAAESFNSVSRVTTASGTYALRVGARLQIHPEGTLETEGDWLRRLGERGMAVPALRANRTGAVGTEVDTGDGETRTCALFDWIGGRSLRTRLTAPTAAALGRLAARLHADAEAWVLPGRPDVLVADRVLHWRLPTRLTEPEVPCGGVFADALERAQAGLDQLWRNPPHRPYLLHGDLTPANVIVARDGGLVPIDFQDLVWGFDVQDLAISIAALRRTSGGTRLVDAFRSGYAELRPWPVLPDELLETLLAARVLHQVNLTLNVRRPADVAEYLAAHAQRLREWLRASLEAA